MYVLCRNGSTGEGELTCCFHFQAFLDDYVKIKQVRKNLTFFVFVILFIANKYLLTSNFLTIVFKLIINSSYYNSALKKREGSVKICEL